MKKKILAIFLTSLMLLSLAACGGNNATDGDITAADSGSSANPDGDSNEVVPFFTDFTTTALDGKEYTADVFTGNKLTMVNVWGTFCAPCISEMPDLEKLSKAYADKGLVIVGVVSDVYDYMAQENNADKIKKAENIVAETGVSYINLLPSESLNAAKLDYITTFPTTYFLNEKGEIITGEYVGSRSYDQWANIIEGLLAE